MEICMSRQNVGGGSQRTTDVRIDQRMSREAGEGVQRRNRRAEWRVACSASAPRATSHRFLREELTKWPLAAFPFLSRALFRLYGVRLPSIWVSLSQLYTNVEGGIRKSMHLRRHETHRSTEDLPMCKELNYLTGLEGAASSFFTKMQNEYRYVCSVLIHWEYSPQ